MLLPFRKVKLESPSISTRDDGRVVAVMAVRVVAVFTPQTVQRWRSIIATLIALK